MKNYRKPRVIRHRSRKAMPPTSMRTRKMARLEHQLSINELEGLGEVSRFSQNRNWDSEIILKDLTSEHHFYSERNKEISADETPFGEYHGEYEILEHYLSVQEI